MYLTFSSIFFHVVPLIAVDALVIVVELLFGGWNLFSCNIHTV